MWCLDNFPDPSLFPKDIIKDIRIALRNPTNKDDHVVKRMVMLFHPDKIRVRTTDNYLFNLSLEITKQLLALVRK